MQRNSKEFYEMRNEFEKLIKSKDCPYLPTKRLDRDDSGGKYAFYENEYVNLAFRFYMHGYALSKSMHQGD